MAFTQLAESREGRLEWLRGELQRQHVQEGRLMGIMDADGSGKITLSEWEAGLNQLGINLRPGDYQKLFFDIDSLKARPSERA